MDSRYCYWISRKYVGLQRSELLDVVVIYRRRIGILSSIRMTLATLS